MMNESSWEGAQDFIDEKVNEYIEDHLEEIVLEHLEEVLQILGKNPMTVDCTEEKKMDPEWLDQMVEEIVAEGL